MQRTTLTLVFIWSIGIFAVFSAQVPLPTFNDPRFGDQFYLNERFGVTMNIYKAWNKGYTGRGVTVCIHDPTGVERGNVEIASKYVAQGSFNFITNTPDPNPDSGGLTYGRDAHGTMMAGLAAASANNGVCGVGVAYDASVSGIRMFQHSALNATEQAKDNRFARTLEYANNINDIYSCSWGLLDIYGYDIGYMAPVVHDVIRKSTEQGRGGKGNIYLFSAGNGGYFNVTCGYDEFKTSIYTVVISVVTGKNVRSRQNVKCSAISAVTYARDNALGVGSSDDLMPSCGLRNSCVRTTGASSAAAAVGSGIMALVLQANPNIGWRDVQHLIARTSASNFNSVPWKTNKAGIKVSDDFGFGLLDAYALTSTAKNWTNVGPHLNCSVQFTVPEPIDGIRMKTKTVDMTTWPASCGGEIRRINYLEHVVLELALNFTRLGNIEIEVTSPSGTPSVILRSGSLVDGGGQLKNLSTMSLHFWGESPRGVWSISFRNVRPNPSDSGILINWSLKLYGTAEDPLASNRIVNDTLSPSTVNNTATPTQQTNEQTSMAVTQPVTQFRNRTSSFTLSSANTTIFSKNFTSPNSGVNLCGLTILSTLFMVMSVQTLFS